MTADLHLELTRIIAESGLTREQIAERLGTQHPNVTKMLAKGYNPTVRTLERLAQALGYQLEVKFTKGEQK